jgi:ankyrin repeat protein
VGVAAEKGHLDVVEYLVQEVADVGAARQALRYAVRSGHVEVVQCLMEAQPTCNPEQYAEDLPQAFGYTHVQVSSLRARREHVHWASEQQLGGMLQAPHEVSQV